MWESAAPLWVCPDLCTYVTSSNSSDLAGSSDGDERRMAKRPALTIKRTPAAGGRARGPAGQGMTAAKHAPAGGKRRRKVEDSEREAISSDDSDVVDLAEDEGKKVGLVRRGAAGELLLTAAVPKIDSTKRYHLPASPAVDPAPALHTQGCGCSQQEGARDG